MENKKRFFSFIIISLSSFFLILGIGNFGYFNLPVIAQAFRPENVSLQAYESLENFPLENQYISQETGEIDQENTLIMRLIRYHQYIKRRPIQYRFDWKLTLADYLDVNEPMLSEQYPGRTVLTENPFENDRLIIQSLTRQEREELINVLVSIYNPQNVNQNSHNSSENNNQNSPPLLNLPESGAADLLRF